MKTKKKKVLFFNAKRTKCEGVSPHLGLAMLSAVLKNAGHEVLIVDYQFKQDAPSPKIFLDDFSPDVVGITLYTATMYEATKIIEVCSEFRVPIIIGGPHVSLYFKELLDMANYIVVGEAENIILDLVENAQISKKGQIIRSESPDPKKLPFPDFKSFYGHQDIEIYPLLTSRGCPYNCSFCAVHLISTKKWRPKNPEDCIQELIFAKSHFKDIYSIIIYDDNPMFKKNHIKNFIKMYLEENINLPLTIINTRADSLDDEVISLLKKAKCPSIGIGVESGDPEVFKKIKKGETLEDIEKAAKLIKSHRIPLALCFVIGLQGDSLISTKKSIQLAKKLKPDHVYWNMITPFKGTLIRDWYDKKGTVYNLVDHSSYVDGDFMCEEPCAETPEFTIEERKKAYILAILKTNDTRLNFSDIPRLIPYVRKYGFYMEFINWIPLNMWKSIKKPFHLLDMAIKVYPEIGMKKLLRRIYK